MTASEPGSDVPSKGDSDPGTHRHGPVPAATASGEARLLGSKPIVWKWWLLAAAISLGLWAGIFAFVV